MPTAGLIRSKRQGRRPKRFLTSRKSCSLTQCCTSARTLVASLSGHGVDKRSRDRQLRGRLRGCRAHGVHLWQSDLPLASMRSLVDPWQIVSTRNTTKAEVRTPLDGGADYVAVRPIFPSRGTGVIDTLEAACTMVPTDGPPITAYAGIIIDNVVTLRSQGRIASSSPGRLLSKKTRRQLSEQS